ncbi:hypothetical protein MKW94_000334 [Papaver nudicaule]|uniref:GATA-type domain-containing protein n=1 Tax=Papaver nudicaule TaxID=74823 RepID=A0AA41S3M4_PAPNU|nr:hypothetical protein [Papaver nudicaule]
MPLSPDTVVPGHVRSKRPRSAIFSPQPDLNLASPKSCITNVQNLPSILQNPIHHIHPNLMEKNRRRKNEEESAITSYSSDHDDPLQQQQQPGVPVKKCLHCEIAKTPEWRTGPMGPRTLCNACGMLYRSGQLIPEYRPAASPTFVASIHSNSHRKILEMMKAKVTPDR